MKAREPMTERELAQIAHWIEMAGAPGRISLSGNSPRVAGWCALAENAAPARLYSEVRRLRAENDRLCVLIAYVDDASPLKQVKRVMNENEAGQLWEAARRRGRALVEKGEDA